MASGECHDTSFWQTLDGFLSRCQVIVDRPAGTAHPYRPSQVYPLDYGYLEGTTAMDGGGIDVWIGSDVRRELDALLVTIDPEKKDTEIKLLLGCDAQETRIVVEFLQRFPLPCLLVQRDRD